MKLYGVEGCLFERMRCDASMRMNGELSDSLGIGVVVNVALLCSGYSPQLKVCVPEFKSQFGHSKGGPPSCSFSLLALSLNGCLGENLRKMYCGT